MLKWAKNALCLIGVLAMVLASYTVAFVGILVTLWAMFLQHLEDGLAGMFILFVGTCMCYVSYLLIVRKQ